MIYLVERREYWLTRIYWEMSREGVRAIMIIDGLDGLWGLETQFGEIKQHMVFQEVFLFKGFQFR